MVSLFLGHIIFLLLKLQVFNYGLKKKKGDNKKMKNLVFENIQEQLIFYMEINVLHNINY